LLRSHSCSPCFCFFINLIGVIVPHLFVSVSGNGPCEVLSAMTFHDI
jgi:hypothetical protein